MHASILAVIVLGACASERGYRGADDVATWSGWVYAAPPTAEEPPTLDVGDVVFLPDEGAAVAAWSPYTDLPAYRSVDLTPGVAVSIVVTGPDAYPAVWRAQAPVADGAWSNGALFGAQAEYLAATYADFVDWGVTPPALGEGVHLWGRPLVPEDWTCDEVRVGARPADLCLTIREDGRLWPTVSGPVDRFYVFGLDAGEVVLTADGFEERWVAPAGSVVFAYWLWKEPV